MISSKTVAAIDEAAAQVALLFGDVVEDVGDFVVDTVQDLPQTIDRVSQRVGDAVESGNERVGVHERTVDSVSFFSRGLIFVMAFLICCLRENGFRTGIGILRAVPES